jgi:hypothetical protein
MAAATVNKKRGKRRVTKKKAAKRKR